MKKKLISVSCTGHKGTIRHYFDKNEEAIRTKLEQKLEGYDINTPAKIKAKISVLFMLEATALMELIIPIM